MKKAIALSVLTLIIIFFSCKTQNDNTGDVKVNNTDNNEKAQATTQGDTVRIANDELEYEVIIIDPGFNYWLQSRARPRGHYSQAYFENKNRLWVNEWNNRVLATGRYGNMYQMPIDYSSSIDYGYEVNYLLYNYLVYFQITNRQRLGGVVPQY